MSGFNRPSSISNIATGLDFGVFTKLYVTDIRRKFAFFRFGAGEDEDRPGRGAKWATIIR
jgi:hypothetical protein